MQGGEEISRPLPLPWDAVVDISARQPDSDVEIVLDEGVIAHGRGSAEAKALVEAGTHYIGIRWRGGPNLPNPLVNLRAAPVPTRNEETLTPSPVTTREAIEYGHLFAIQQDLGFVIRALDRLTPLIPDDSDDASLIAEALWSAALIAYTRCFTSGRRTALRFDDLGLPQTIADLHRHLDSMRDKHIAHPVSDLEQVSVLSARAPDGEIHLLTLVDRHIAGTPEQVVEFRHLVEAVLASIQPRMDRLAEVVMGQLKTASKTK